MLLRPRTQNQKKYFPGSNHVSRLLTAGKVIYYFTQCTLLLAITHPRPLSCSGFFKWKQIFMGERGNMIFLT